MRALSSWLDDAAQAAAGLLHEMEADPAGRFSSSIYETGRLVSLAPSLPGHRERVRFLLDRQRLDGGWGGPGNYALVPTLSATEALLTEGNTAAVRGLGALFRWLNGPEQPTLPDTVAIEIIVPALIADINAHLARRGGHRLLSPESTDTALLGRLREEAANGRPMPPKLLHSLEILGPDARNGFSAVGGHDGVGCSPAATAAWLGDHAIRTGRDPAVRYLNATRALDGGVPVAAPLGLFERSWVLATLAEAGLTTSATPELVHSLRSALSDSGASGGPGLPPDVDDTATVLYALALLGHPQPPDSLRPYHSGTHFSCFPDERTPSCSANAHVLQALGRSGAETATLAYWLCERQNPDGSWSDKWHASPHYATRCCAVALAEHGGAASTKAISLAAHWVLCNQYPDGSWGTQEETAYALRVLLVRDTSPTTAAAITRGVRYLLDSSADKNHPPLWHDKDLYTPTRIVQAEILAALQLSRTDRDVGEPVWSSAS
ncbi:prenyltransferase/squalene oxidase repeat-containing protein [Amycolatopsis sp. H20-H5]|uniref:prenyltransferase/squalene oxidase repeat-containing protein n=1 Tax=Amycolatopsis sp. H20-H5 TaxID=3046309 RepID=UPI002DBDEF7C|nr:prenyltransferase/squalene oxidase repeat-containing protein [Amycolatopsis sp. H20-H5]MEC3979205.1 prenyltransferase/squalene oxidase repeat-containing protein [Amycolatopsis sp. H20-H5]